MTLAKLQHDWIRKGLFSFSLRRFSLPIILFLFSFSLSPTAKAESLNIVSDIRPVHSLVRMVLGDLGTSELIASRSVSPHDYVMRPSEVRLVSEADIIFWTGPSILPALEKFLEELPPETQVISLLDEIEDSLLPIRDPVSFYEDDDHDKHDEHDHGSHDDDHEGHDDHDEHAHEGHDDHDKHDEHDHGSHDDDHEGHDDHDDHANEGHGHGHHHDHGDFDPHAWLDPNLVLEWIDIIADVMSDADSANQETYLSNAEQAKARIIKLDEEINDRLHDENPKFVLYHDAFQYFELHYGLNAIGSISDIAGSDPGARHIRRLIDRISEIGVSCAFSEPLFEDDLLETVVSGADIKVYEIDPTGARLEPGPDLYLELISSIAENFIECGSKD
ncbi:MAG: zinc ABC transporter substrate-binding protein [Rhodobacteraceae bacterium]|nr:zinc ABC transporter substrate-binding protein [Paracoccaceae bacterium]